MQSKKSSIMRAPPNTIALLLQLPREIRDMIYTYIIAVESHRSDASDVSLKNPKTLELPDYINDFKSVSEELYHELASEYIESRRFVPRNLSAAELFIIWLSSVHRGFDHVRRLWLHDFDPASPAAAHSNLLIRCTKLESLTLNGHSSKFVCAESVKEHTRDRSYEVVPQRMENLDMYRALRNLRRLDWRLPAGSSVQGTEVACQLKLLVGISVQVYIGEINDVGLPWSELITEEEALSTVRGVFEQQMMFGYLCM